MCQIMYPLTLSMLELITAPERARVSLFPRSQQQNSRWCFLSANKRSLYTHTRCCIKETTTNNTRWAIIPTTLTDQYALNNTCTSLPSCTKHSTAHYCHIGFLQSPCSVTIIVKVTCTNRIWIIGVVISIRTSRHLPIDQICVSYLSLTVPYAVNAVRVLNECQVFFFVQLYNQPTNQRARKY